MAFLSWPDRHAPAPARPVCGEAGAAGGAPYWLSLARIAQGALRSAARARAHGLCRAVPWSSPTPSPNAQLPRLEHARERPAPDVFPVILRGLDGSPIEDQFAGRDARVAILGDRVQPRGVELRHRLLRVPIQRIEQADVGRVESTGTSQIAQGFTEVSQRRAVLDLDKHRPERGLGAARYTGYGRGERQQAALFDIGGGGVERGDITQ